MTDGEKPPLMRLGRGYVIIEACERERRDVRLGTDRGVVEESFKVGRSERERF